jgi:hypothetical protein
MLQVAQLYLFSMTGALLDSVLVRISSYKCERLLKAPQVYRMYIVWGRYWPLVVLPCTCIAAYMISAVVRYSTYTRARSTSFKPPQMLLQTCIHISQSLRHPSQFIEVLHEVQNLRSDTIIALSLAVFANSFCTGAFSRVEKAL